MPLANDGVQPPGIQQAEISARVLGNTIAPIVVGHYAQLKAQAKKINDLETVVKLHNFALHNAAREFNEQADEIRQLKRNPCVRLGNICNLM